MRDPVTGYEYPDPWVSSCNSQEARDLVARGLAVLTASGTVLRRGFTTGTTAAAACKAAILSQRGPVASVRIRTPCGIAVDVPVRGAGGSAECRKYSGDYPGDATAGIRIIATAEERGEGVVLEAGAGIGTYGRTTPRFRKGTPAITEGPLSCILQSVANCIHELHIARKPPPAQCVHLHRDPLSRTNNPAPAMNRIGNAVELQHGTVKQTEDST